VFVAGGFVIFPVSAVTNTVAVPLRSIALPELVELTMVVLAKVVPAEP
jgi:hypothetical protein